MINPKIFFPYLFSLVSLIIAFGMVGQGQSAEVELFPTPTPSATPLSRPEPFPGAVRVARCQALSQPRFFIYRPILTPDLPQHLLISGTVYASDLSPLPNALIEIWQRDDTQVNQPILFSVAVRTDKAGHYEFNLMKPTPSAHIYFHYRVTYRDYCPLSLHLHLVTEASPKPAQPPAFAKVVEVTGPVLTRPATASYQRELAILPSLIDITGGTPIITAIHILSMGAQSV